MALCACPPESEIQDIPVPTCFEDFGEIRKIIIQRTYDGTTENVITIATNNPNLLATWSALLTAADNTKVQVTPEFAEFNHDEAEPREASSTGVGGINKILGDNYSTAGGYFHSLQQKVMKKIRKYNCEVGTSVWVINEHGQIGGIADDNETPTTFKGIPVRSFYAGTKTFGNRDDVDKNRIMWKFLPNWSDEFYVVNPTDFNALTGLSGS